MKLDLDVSALKSLVEAVEMVLAMWKEPQVERHDARQKFVVGSFADIHEQMTAINDDYRASFRQAIKLLDERRDLAMLADLLDEQRDSASNSHAAVRGFATAIGSMKKDARFRRADVEAFARYSKAINSYFDQAGPGDKVSSWYREFVDYVRACIDLPDKAFGPVPSIASGAPPAEIARLAYHNALRQYLPAAWTEYCAAYQALLLVLER